MTSHPKRATILVVDDHKGARDLLALHLGPTYDVITAETAQEAIRDLHTHRIDLVIQDLGLPDMHGLQLLHTSKLLHPQLPVILITGGADLKAATEAIQYGAVAYLLKPFNLTEIQLLIANFSTRSSDVDGDLPPFITPELRK
jgi:DNA-binding NtrC family response regulator